MPVNHENPINDGQFPEQSGMPRREALATMARATAGAGVIYAGLMYAHEASNGISDGLDTVADAFLGEPSHDRLPLTDEEIEEWNSSKDQFSEGFQQDMDEIIANPEVVHHDEGPDVIDYAGTALFAHGINNLKNGNSITQGHYFGLGALIGLKRHKLRREGNEEALHHVNNEIASTIQFTEIIQTTVIVAEGMLLDIEEIYSNLNEGGELSLLDHQAVVSEMGASLAWLITTVGAAGTTKDEAKNFVDRVEKLRDQMVNNVTKQALNMSDKEYAQKLQEGDESISRIKGHLQGSIADDFGFPGVGDPPFIATMERFGSIGLLWQSIAVGIPMLSRALVQSNTGIVKELISMGIVEGDPEDAKRIAIDALRRNSGFVGGILARSAKNLTKIMPGMLQDENGLQHHIWKSVSDKIQGFMDLALRKEIPSHGHEDEGSRIEDYSHYKNFLTLVIDRLPERDDLTHQARDIAADRLNIKRYIDADDWDGLTDWMESQGIDTTIAGIFKVSAQEIEEEILKEQGFNGDNAKPFNPLAIYRRVTSIDRMQKALGHSFTDVLNVFPFQSASMIFVSPVFKKVADKLDSFTDALSGDNRILKPIMKVGNHFAKFKLIAKFSQFADNLVGVREGYKFVQDNPAIALIAGIKGGKKRPSGNMANVVEFSLSDYTMEEAKRNGSIHDRSEYEGFVWAEVLGMADYIGRKTGIDVIKFPTAKSELETASGEGPSQETAGAMSRRGLFNRFRTNEATDVDTETANYTINGRRRNSDINPENSRFSGKYDRRGLVGRWLFGAQETQLQTDELAQARANRLAKTAAKTSIKSSSAS